MEIPVDKENSKEYIINVHMHKINREGLLCHVVKSTGVAVLLEMRSFINRLPSR